MAAAFLRSALRPLTPQHAPAQGLLASLSGLSLRRLSDAPRDSAGSPVVDRKPFDFPSLPRDTQVSLLTAALFTEAQKHHATVFGLAGGDGIGKSTFIHQLLAFAATGVRPVSKDGSALRRLEAAAQTANDEASKGADTQDGGTGDRSSKQSAATTLVVDHSLPKPPVTYPLPNETRLTVAFDFNWPASSFDDFLRKFDSALFPSVSAGVAAAGISGADLLGLANQAASIDHVVDATLTLFTENQIKASQAKQPAANLSPEQKLLMTGKLLTMYSLNPLLFSREPQFTQHPIVQNLKDIGEYLGAGGHASLQSYLKQNASLVAIYAALVYHDKHTQQARASLGKGNTATSSTPAPTRKGHVTLGFLMQTLNAVNDAENCRVLYLLLNLSPFPGWIAKATHPALAARLFSDFHDRLLLNFKMLCQLEVCPPCLVELDDPFTVRDYLVDSNIPSHWLDAHHLLPFPESIGQEFFIPNMIFSESEWSEVYAKLGGYPKLLADFIKDYWSCDEQTLSWLRYIAPSVQATQVGIALQQFVSDKTQAFLAHHLKSFQRVFLLEKEISSLRLSERLGRSRRVAHEPARPAPDSRRAPAESAPSRLAAYSAFLESCLPDSVRHPILDKFEREGLSVADEMELVDAITRFCESRDVCYEHVKAGVFLDHPAALALLAAGMIEYQKEGKVVFASPLHRVIMEVYCAEFIERLSVVHRPQWLLKRHVSGMLSIKGLQDILSDADK